MAEWMLGHTKHHLGRLAEARVHLQRSLDIDTEKARLAQVNAVGYDRRVDTLGNLASTLWLQGFPEQARVLGMRALEEALGSSDGGWRAAADLLGLQLGVPGAGGMEAKKALGWRAPFS